MKSTKKGSNSLNQRLDKISKKLDIIIVILLAQSGLTRKEAAEVCGISEKTIERMLPFEKLKPKRHEK